MSTTAQITPPFRAEHIGSLLRPAGLLALRARVAAGQADAADLTAAEDAAIRGATELQARVGLRLATDGEFRRQSYHSYFYQQLGDVSLEAPPEDPCCDSGHNRGAQPQARIGSRLVWRQPIHVGDFQYLASLTGALPKITIPGPCALHFRGGDAAVLASAYTDVEQFWDDTVRAYRSELTALAEAGCTYVQIDETAFAKFGDPDVQEMLRARGDDWSTLIDTYIEITNRVLDGLPPGLRIGMHLCRGNRGGMWHAEGSYESVADRLFNKLGIRFFFLEYDTPRAGSFTPLRLVPRDKSVILGLVSTKTSAMEDPGALKRRLDDATRFVDVDRLGISPQCGFASVDTGNPISPEAQEAKLRLVVALAQDVWGTC